MLLMHCLVVDRLSSPLKSGLSSCTSLHGFRLCLYVDFGWSIRYNSFHDDHILALCFSAGLNLYSLLNADHLHYLGYIFDYEKAPHSELQDIRALDWEKLRSLCSRIPDLRSLSLDMFLHENTQQREYFSTCAGEELQGFEQVISYGEPGTFFRCDEEMCPWFSRSWLGCMRPVPVCRDLRMRRLF